MDSSGVAADQSDGRRPAWPSLVIGLGLTLLLVLGVTALALAWSRAAGSSLVPLQIPALLAATVGLSLIGTGLAALDLNGLRRQEAQEADVLEAAVDRVRRWAEPGRPVRID